MEKYKEIERSIIKTYRKEIWHPFAKACADYQLISEGDNIMVCISGGKDSFLLAKCIQEIQAHGRIPFEAHYVVMNPGYSEHHLQQILDNAKLLNVPIEVFNTSIFDIANSTSKGSPCYLCARMRRGALYTEAQRLGCNKIALGHHFNDVIETTLMSMLYGAECKTMVPKLHSDNFKGIDLIRPMYLVHEDAILLWCHYNELHFINCACKFTESLTVEDENKSKRREMKNMIKEMKKYNPNVEFNLFKSMANVSLDCVLAYTKNGEKRTFLDDFDESK